MPVALALAPALAPAHWLRGSGWAAGAGTELHKAPALGKTAGFSAVEGWFLLSIAVVVARPPLGLCGVAVKSKLTVITVCRSYGLFLG